MRYEASHHNPPRHGEGDHAQHGGGGSLSLRRPEIERARKLRRAMTLPEVLLWQRLRRSAGGVRFRRQHPIGPYVVDFCCVAERLVVEIDGATHDGEAGAAHDAARDDFIVGNGYRLIHIPARDVLRDVEAVAAAVVALASRPLHHPPAADGPPPRSGEELGVSRS